MNYLGHLYFSGNRLDLMLANLFGDFVKGSDYTYLPQIVQEGVGLHRNIDDFIDHHPLILQLLNDFLYESLPKVGNIAIDLYMDHLLARYWNKYHQLSLEQFEKQFFSYALNQKNQIYKTRSINFKYPEEFIQLLKIIHQKSWILKYKEIEGLAMACKGLSKRITFKNNLNEAHIVFLENENKITKTFFSFMKDAENRFNIQ